MWYRFVFKKNFKELYVANFTEVRRPAKALSGVSMIGRRHRLDYQIAFNIQIVLDL
jgi:hypothetical protein